MKTLEKPAEKAARKGSKRNPEASRRALIEATLDTIAEDGITDTSVSSIIERAGLSRGMIHLHFGGKDNLLTEAAKFFSEEYYAEMDRMLEDCDGSPEARVMAVVEGDLSESLMNPRSTRIWHAFRGVANSHPGIAAHSSTQDDRLVDVVRRAFEEICAEDGLDRSLAQDANYGVLALLEGMWVHYIADRDRFSREASAALIRRFLAGLFPGRFVS